MIWEVKSLEEAIAWVKRGPMTVDSVVEIRPSFSPEHFEALEQEWRQRKESQRAEIASRTKR
jgi:hypothetical protein